MDIKLMPEKYHKSSKKVSLFRDGFTIDSDHLLLFSLSLLLLIIILCLGLWGYKIYLSRDIDTSITEIEELQSQRNFELEADFANLKIKIEDFKQIAKVHVYPSKIFKILEELTIPQIKFIGLDVNLLEAELILETESIDYNTLAKQIVVFEDDSRIKNVDLSGVNLDDSGKVNSNLKIKIDSDFLYSE